MSGIPATQKKFTWLDYQSWPEDERWELLDGEAFAMSPTPSVRHQQVLGELMAQLVPQFRNAACRVFAAPLDVKFDDLNCTEPDLMIVCNPDQIRHRHIEGPPQLVVEILSEHSVSRDRIRKMRLYARFGVKEYWIITPWPPMIEVYHLDGPTYRLAGSFRKEDAFLSPGFPDLKLDLSLLFNYPPDPNDAVEVVKEPPAVYARR
jgi:Uma2 family endonuclease